MVITEVDTYHFEYLPNTPMKSSDNLGLSFSIGDINNYPFETFSTNVFQIRATGFNLTSFDVPVEVRMTLYDQSFTSRIQELVDIVSFSRMFILVIILFLSVTSLLQSDSSDGTLISVQMLIQRSFATKVCFFTLAQFNCK